MYILPDHIAPSSPACSVRPGRPSHSFSSGRLARCVPDMYIYIYMYAIHTSAPIHSYIYI